jgi:hypothetical protein
MEFFLLKELRAMGANDNGDSTSKPVADSRVCDRLDHRSDDVMLGGAATGVALGMLYMDAAHSLALAMQNAVVEQQNGWAVHRSVMFKAVEQFLKNDAGDRAIDLLLGALAKQKA